MYIISAERNHFVFPVLYILTPDKSQETYEFVLRKVKEIWPCFSPLFVSIDYELGMINAVKNVLPNSSIWGCIFHLFQNLKKKINKSGLLRRYNADPDFALQCSMYFYLNFNYFL